MIEPAVHAVSLAGERVELCRLESELLHLASDPQRVFTSTSYQKPYGDTARPAPHERSTVTPVAYAASSAPRGERWVINEWGVGYRLIGASRQGGVSRWTAIRRFLRLMVVCPRARQAQG